MSVPDGFEDLSEQSYAKLLALAMWKTNIRDVEFSMADFDNLPDDMVVVCEGIATDKLRVRLMSIEEAKKIKDARDGASQL